MFLKKRGGWTLLEFLLLLSFLGIIIVSFFKTADTRIKAKPQQTQITACTTLVESCIFHTNTTSSLPFFAAPNLSVKK